MFNHKCFVASVVLAIDRSKITTGPCIYFEKLKLSGSNQYKLNADNLCIKRGWAMTRLFGDVATLLPEEVRLPRDTYSAKNTVKDIRRIDFRYTVGRSTKWIGEDMSIAKMMLVSNNVLRNLLSPNKADTALLAFANYCDGVTKMTMREGVFRCQFGEKGPVDLHREIAVLCFTPKFLDEVVNRCEGGLRYTSVYIGYRKPTPTLIPVRPTRNGIRIVYRQGDTDRCMAYGVANALHSMGDTSTAERVAAAADDFKHEMDIVRFMENSGYGQSKPIKQCPKTMSLIEFLLEEQSLDPIMCTLKDSGGGQRHSVTLWNGWVFDAADDYAMPLTQTSLDVSAGHGYTCTATTKAYKFSLYSRKRKRE